MTILLDECVSKKFASYLRRRGLEDIISIQEKEAMCGMQDPDIAVFAKEYDMILVTQDKGFYYSYNGDKVFFKHNNWKRTYKQIKTYYDLL